MLSSGHRNSLFVSSVVKSILAMIDSLHCTALLDGSSVNVKEINMIHMTRKNVYDTYRDDIATVAGTAGYLAELGATGSPYTFNINKQTLIDDLHAELSALSSRVERARRGEFKLYTGFSWPVIYGTGDNDHNHNAFQLAGEMPAARRTPMEFYLSKMAKVAGFAVHAFEETQREGRAARARGGDEPLDGAALRQQGRQ
jgi:hypothetical protein